MPITEFLERNARDFGDDISLVEINPTIQEDRRVTWKEYELIESNTKTHFRREISWNVFDEKANRFANMLLARGVKKGDKVAILMVNCLEWLPIYFGILKTGALAVPLNFRYSSDEILYCVQLSEADALVFGPSFIGRVEEIAEEVIKKRLLIYVGENCPSFADDYNEMCANSSSKAPHIQISDEDDAAIYFSSGTTGFPKAILHKHSSLVHACKTEQKHHGQMKKDIFLCIPPLYHTGAKMHWFGSLIVGGKAVLLKGTSPQAVLDAVSREKCTICWLLVPWAQDILEAIETKKIDLNTYHLKQWRLMHIGAQPVPPSLIRKWKKYFPEHAYDTNYGLSESIGPGCVHLGVENIHKVGCIGKAGYGWTTCIVNEQHEKVKKGEVGELAIKGPGIMSCYYHDPKATEEVLQNGWLYSGDMAKEDEDGFIRLVDRKKDVIISGGENIYPVQIEDYIRTNESIHDVAVIGMPDKRLGEMSCAIVELKEGHQMTEADMNQFCLELPRYKRPHKIIFAKIPRNPTGKIEKPKLRKRYGVGQLIENQNLG